MNSSDNLDSRALHYLDAYGQRFMRPGTYRYTIACAGTGRMSDNWPFEIKVEEGEKGHKMRQHSVRVVHKEGKFMPEERELAIQVGDLVMWSCRQSSAPAYEVAGDQEFFGSARLVNECGYSHAFAAAGDYRWTDSNGSGLSGVVRVRDPECKFQKDLAKWQKELAKGTVVMITGTKAEPSEVEILTGQTVYFAVVKSEGVSITDHRRTDATHGMCDATDSSGGYGT